MKGGELRLRRSTVCAIDLGLCPLQWPQFALPVSVLSGSENRIGGLKRYVSIERPGRRALDSVRANADIEPWLEGSGRLGQQSIRRGIRHIFRGDQGAVCKA